MMRHRADGDSERAGDFMRENRLLHGKFSILTALTEAR